RCARRIAMNAQQPGPRPRMKAWTRVDILRGPPPAGAHMARPSIADRRSAAHRLAGLALGCTLPALALAQAPAPAPVPTSGPAPTRPAAPIQQAAPAQQPAPAQQATPAQ